MRFLSKSFFAFIVNFFYTCCFLLGLLLTKNREFLDCNLFFILFICFAIFFVSYDVFIWFRKIIVIIFLILCKIYVFNFPLEFVSIIDPVLYSNNKLIDPLSPNPVFFNFIYAYFLFLDQVSFESFFLMLLPGLNLLFLDVGPLGVIYSSISLKLESIGQKVLAKEPVTTVPFMEKFKYPAVLLAFSGNRETTLYNSLPLLEKERGGFRKRRLVSFFLSTKNHFTRSEFLILTNSFSRLEEGYNFKSSFYKNMPFLFDKIGEENVEKIYLMLWEDSCRILSQSYIEQQNMKFYFGDLPLLNQFLNSASPQKALRGLAAQVLVAGQHKDLFCGSSSFLFSNFDFAFSKNNIRTGLEIKIHTSPYTFSEQKLASLVLRQIQKK